MNDHDLSSYKDTVWREKRPGRQHRRVRVIFVGIHPDTLGVKVVAHRDPRMMGRETYLTPETLRKEYVRVDE